MDAIYFETARNAPSVLLGQPNVKISHELCGTLRALWLGLLNRQFVVLESLVTEQAASLALHPVYPELAIPGRHYQMGQIFDSVTRGEPQKTVAIERGLSVSSLGGVLRQVIASMGLACNFSRLPLGLPLLAHAIKHPHLVELYQAGIGATSPYVVRFRRPDSAFLDCLSRCEFEVARQYLEGSTYQEIGRARDTSVRTIANQMSSAFKKLGVSGRFALLKKAVQTFERRMPHATETRAERALSTSPTSAWLSRS
jgi:DNA-binding CsgD family transcriptional regulator